MDITLRTPLSFTEIGRKDNQEDRLYPINGASATSRTFILCDGMGGHERGEVAAEVVSSTLGEALDANSSASVSEKEFCESLALCYRALDEKLAGDDSRRPGTTLTCVRFGDNGVLAAHIGDSRIYQIRPGVGIMFRTEDHSLVNELVRAGQISEAEALVHPRRNVITRAMMPGSTNPSKADISIITDIQPGDYFFLCCDGVLERLRDQRLIAILSDTNLSDSGKISAIKDICDKGTRDNYTAWLIPVDRVEGNSVPAGQPQIPISAAASNAVPVQPDIVTPLASAQKKKNNLLIYVIAGAVALIALFAIAITKCSGSDEDSELSPDIIDATEQTQPDEMSEPERDNRQRAAKKVRTGQNKRKQEQHAEEAPIQEQAPEATSRDNEAPSSTSTAAAAALTRPNSSPATDKPDTKPDTKPNTEPQPIQTPEPVTKPEPKPEPGPGPLY